MDNSFFAYLQKLELLSFFSGFPLVYAAIFFIGENKGLKNNFINLLIQNLSLGYALVGTLYIGLRLKNLYPDYSIQNIKAALEQPWLMAWAFLSILFWIPALGKRKFVTFLHSLVFFSILLNDLFLPRSSSAVVTNEMNVYTLSLLLNTAAVLLMALLSYLFAAVKPAHFHY